MLVIVLSLVALLLTVAVKWYWSIAIIKTLTLFLGLEGTVLLASALSPPYDEIKVERPKGIINMLMWSFKEGRGLNYPIQYIPVFYYGGLILLALSLVLSTIAG